jgi:C_GCAxxG_C_C family probable redox protein
MGKKTGFIKRDGEMFNCCESTLMNINKEHPLPGFESNIMKAASSFGGGIYWGSLCGAPAGIAMALGLVYGTDGEESLEEFQDKRKHLKEVSTSLMRGFEEAFGSINCNDLLGVDRRTEEGRALLKELRDTKGYVMCEEYIDWAAKRVLETLGEG